MLGLFSSATQLTARRSADCLLAQTSTQEYRRGTPEICFSRRLTMLRCLRTTPRPSRSASYVCTSLPLSPSCTATGAQISLHTHAPGCQLVCPHRDSVWSNWGSGPAHTHFPAALCNSLHTCCCAACASTYMKGAQENGKLTCPYCRQPCEGVYTNYTV